jgi:ATP adenylyltransferase
MTDTLSVISEPVPGCVFCEQVFKRDRPVMARTSAFFAIPGNEPISSGHTLLIPYGHISRLCDLSRDEFADFKRILGIVENNLAQQGAEDQFNIIIIEGEASSQTYGHLQIHVFPRCRPDIEPPRGNFLAGRKAN